MPGPVVMGAGALALVTAATVMYYWPLIKKRLVRAKNRAIGKYVAKQLHKMFMQEGGVMQLGEYEHPTYGGKVKFFKNAPKTLPEWYALAKKHADLEYIVYRPSESMPGEEIRWTFAEVMARAEELRDNLRDNLGVKKGDRVSILMSNIPEYTVAFIAATKLGAIAVTLNAFWGADEICFGLSDSKSSILIADEKRLLRIVPDGRLEEFRNAGLKVIVVKPTELTRNLGVLSFEELSNTRRAPALFDVDPTIDPEGDAIIMYTSGTTNPLPKGVVQTHASLVQTCYCFQLFTELIKILRGGPKFRRCDLVSAPLFHASTLNSVFLLSFYDGHKLVMIPKWEVDHALNVCIEEKVTFFGAMPAMLSDILASDNFHRNKDKFFFTNIGTGGARCPSKLIHRTAAALPTVQQGSGWGMTETNAIGTIIGGPDFLENPGSCGKAHPIVDLKLIDPDTEQEVKGVNQAGELYIRSVTNMRGYWNNEEETKRAMMPGGWIRTGDLGTIDEDGFVYIIDRVKDIVIRGGENISVSGVEEVVHQYSAQNNEKGTILDVCAFGIEHDRLGEQLALAVVPVPGAKVDLESLKEFLQKRLARFQVPEVYFVRDTPLPRGPTGKILKRKLREEYKTLAPA